MLTNFFKTAIRNIFRHKSYVIINIIGLAVGIACSLLILLFIRHELGYDTFNENYDRIYRIILDAKLGETEIKGAFTPAPLAKTLVTDYPEVENAIRMERWNEVLFRIEDRKYVEENVMLADSAFFDIFSIPLISGNTKKALAEPYKVVLTEKTAKKYYGNEDPIGKTLRINSDTNLYTITGVMENVPENSHFEFNILISFLSHWRAKEEFWLSNSFATYVLLKKNTSAEGLEDKFPAMIEKYVGPQVMQVLGIDIEQFKSTGNRYGFFLQSLSDIHLNPGISQDFRPPTDRKYIYIFSIVSLIIIIVAGINYMNLSTARSVNRSREVGMRKVVGSSRRLLVWQFLMESVMLCLMSLVVAVILVEVMLPHYNNLLQVKLSINYFSEWYTIPALILLAVIIGIFSGSYPALFLASFKPVSVLYGKLKLGISSVHIRSMLVIFQFIITISLILSSLVIYRQIQYMINKDLGFNKEMLFVISRTDALRKRIVSFRQEIEKLSGIIGSTNSTAIPGYPNNHNGFLMEGKTSDQTYLMQVNWADYDYLKTYGIELKEGRYFSRDFSSDTLAMVINEKAIEEFGLTDPMAARFIEPAREGEQRTVYNVIGVVKDFHYQALRERIFPHVFILKPERWDWTAYITIRLAPENVKGTIAEIEKIWNKFTNNEPLEYFFLDDSFRKFYFEEIRTSRIAVAFSILAIIIACLGLFGLTSFATELRSHEIGIRKVLGSSVYRIIILFTREIFLLILVSTIPAWILSYFLMKRWLMNFHYHIHLQPWEFVSAFLVALFIALITICYRTYRAAIVNPSKVLKYE
ncbi:MAG: ABC transporter permease [Bacteroidales bacterium]|nr:ABC transporter permease [Bacteroidales bacterium]